MEAISQDSVSLLFDTLPSQGDAYVVGPSRGLEPALPHRSCGGHPAIEAPSQDKVSLPFGATSSQDAASDGYRDPLPIKVRDFHLER